MSKLGEQIYLLRRKKGLTQTELGETIGVSQKAITNYETGRREPGIDIIIKIAQTLNASVEQLIGTKITETGQETDRSLMRTFEKVRRMPKNKQKAFISFVNTLAS
jgi:transcriptional regulator with XRE-family HTH domain